MRVLVALMLPLAAFALPNIVYKKGELALQDPAEVGEVVLSPRPHEWLGAKELPESWDWRNVDGVSYVTQSLNQHIPQYCGSCWAHAALSSIADRLKIMGKDQRADVIPSIQVMINCGTAGSCHGGDSNAANAWVYKNGGIPDTTCQPYEAKDHDCTPENICRNCNFTMTRRNTCFAVTDYPKITISEYGAVSGDDNIMAEIYARGPVSCYIDANPIEEYSGGVSMYEGADGTNHAIQLAGWGVDQETGTPYWIGRNSWGRYWGEKGWFRIVRGGAYNPGECYWAVPDVTDY